MAQLECKQSDTTALHHVTSDDRSDAWPIRAEVYGLEGLENHARTLADWMKNVRVEVGRPLIRRLRRDALRLQKAYGKVREACKAGEALGHDAEWLLDNHHIVNDALAEIEVDLPHGYYRWLPKLVDGTMAGYPRVYALAMELTAHCDSLFDESNISRFVQAFQSIAPLNVGELWATPIMLRLCLVDNLRRLAEQVVHQQSLRQKARNWVSARLPQLEASSGGDPFELNTLAEEWRDCYTLHLLEGTHEHEMTYPRAADRLREFLDRCGHTAAEVLRREKERQAANQVSISNCVTSLRLLSALDWSHFFEKTSLLEAALRRDPAGIYARQDFATRDRYRQIVEYLSRRSNVSELDVAETLLRIADAEPPARPLERHIGYYLIDEGRPQIEKQIGFRAPSGSWLRRAVLRRPRCWYFTTLFAATLLMMAALGWGCARAGVAPALLVLFLAAALAPISQLAVSLLDVLVAAILNPRVLPRLNFSDGVPPNCASFLVVPSLLTSRRSAEALVERLEIHYLSNPEESLSFALLTDFADAPAQTMPDDEACLAAAREGVARLNEKYGEGGEDRFFLFHRERRWNPGEGCWMGWERKRGKLAEFNRLLRTGERGTFTTIVGGLDGLSIPAETPAANGSTKGGGIRYVITLDTDTQMPREAARKLIAAMAHPLNQPVFDTAAGRVVRGYGVMQPRISLSLLGGRRSLFARIFTGSAGLDPYTTAVSDTYQDLFGSGSFTGKGIYDVDAFRAAAGQRFPENRILSHDLIEGNFARCGLVSDVELIDDFPAHYQAYARREHRWTRGDWQIASWLGNRVSAADGRRAANTLPLVERWKIFDNLRRSLAPPSLLAAMLIGWTMLPDPWWCTLGAAVAIAWPLVLTLAAWPLRAVRQLASVGRAPPIVDLGATMAQAGFSAIMLLDQALSMLDAIGRTLCRLAVSRRRLLEWETSAAAERRQEASLSGSFGRMWRAEAALVSIAVLIWLANPTALPAAAPFLLGWLAAPAAAWWSGRWRPDTPIRLSPDEQALLRRWARLTWAFFETFVGDEDHWLPPDNYQEQPRELVAHRTSPTNIGLYLVSCVAAHRLGFLTWPALLDRLEKTMTALHSLERAHGHFYNWYDTQTLAGLRPIYLSTVDSGNLAVSLLTLKQCLLEGAAAPRWGPAVVDGLRDTLRLAETTMTPANPRAASLNAALGRVPEGADERRTWSEKIAIEAAALCAECAPGEAHTWAERLARLARDRCDELAADPSANRERAERLANDAEALAEGMDFHMLYNRERDLFAVGYNLTAGQLDNAHYDLLASESCLVSFLAVARGDVPRKHWFRLGRPMTRAGGSLVLLSWGGTMFEYLMPRLFLPLCPGTLLEQSQKGAVDAQIAYGRHCRRPWGISESAFNEVDAQWNYQYQAFGAPGLGLKRGLGKDLVVAPYATGLAVMIDPKQSIKNYRRLAHEGAEGRYGMYEAVDYTVDRLPQNQSFAVVKCFMAHHQGMTLLALANRLFGDLFPQSFRAEPMVRATELLLHERVPREAPTSDREPATAFERPFHESSPQLSRRITTPHTAHPRTQLLASEHYSLLLTNAGSGQSRARGLALTRWREDRTEEAWGQFIYVRDLRDGGSWSAGYQPVCKEADEYEATFATDKAVIRRVDGPIETRMEVTISPENHAEVRRLTFTNHDTRSHYLEVTSYAEVVLAPQSADLAHPAFGKLFMEMEYLSSAETLVCRRRPRGPDEKPIWALHVMTPDGSTFGTAQFETDRGRFLGRGRSAANPAALDPDHALAGRDGPALDPIFCLRRRLRVKASATASIAFITAMANSRDEAISLADHYRDFHGINRAFELAWAHSQVELRQERLTANDAHLFQRLAAHVVFAGPALRPEPERIAANRQGQSDLWRHGISGDFPIVLVIITQVDGLSLAKQTVAAHAWWRRKGLAADLVIINEQDGGYYEDFQQQLNSLVKSSDDRDLLDKPGGVFLRKSSHLTADDRLLLLAAARCVLVSGRDSLGAQIDRRERQAAALKKRTRRPPAVGAPPAPAAVNEARERLLFSNDLGGFSQNGTEYVLRLTAAEHGYALPPHAWINVIANPMFGTIVSETGGGYTWADNSQSNRLTPWQNDPIADRPGEIIYLTDERSGQVWTATPQPLGAPAEFEVRHGQGYTIFKHTRDGLMHELSVYVVMDQPVKLMRLRLRNTGERPRRVSITYFAEWVLGRTRDQSAMYTVSEIDPESGALFARNAFRPDNSSHVAFADISVRPRTFTADRTEFLGRNGRLSDPAALERHALSGRIGAALDPCAVLQTSVSIPANCETEVIFVLGDAADVAQARQLAQRYREPAQARAALEEVKRYWDGLLDRVTIRTPDRALDLLFNRWLAYQVLSCRMWARSGLYQSSGAYGFRDQLQDSLALLHILPSETRAQILRSAARQFVEGDVQHWWHPPSGAGVRTRFSDDYLWLPYAVLIYAKATGDTGILDANAAYLKAPLLAADQSEDYRVAAVADESGSIYDHCTRAIEHGFRYGQHGLPLMGTGDWNDGMNFVGHQGQGESVWTGWFLLMIARDFAPICQSRGDSERAERYGKEAETLRRNLEEHAWDGSWYRRAYFDDGTPLGSASNDECQIDSIVQSWALISGGAQADRAQQAMAEVERQLIDRTNRLILLFKPPFDHGPLQPGYIKGYVPGVRENGGQYTHAAMWVVKALALLGQGGKALEALDLLNPISHSASPEDAAHFKTEPYALAGDVYSQPPHAGQGGWSWYTGSAGWFYRVVLEDLLGLERHGNSIRVAPRVPAEWSEFEVRYVLGKTRYVIRGRRGPPTFDGAPWEQSRFPFIDDGREHEIVVNLGP